MLYLFPELRGRKTGLLLESFVKSSAGLEANFLGNRFNGIIFPGLALQVLNGNLNPLFIDQLIEVFRKKIMYDLRESIFGYSQIIG